MGHGKYDFLRIYLLTSLFDEVKVQMFIIYSSKKSVNPKKYYKYYIMYKSKQLIDNKDGF